MGKTTVARELAIKLGAYYVNLTEFAKQNNLILCEDEERHTSIVNEDKMQEKLAEAIEITQKTDIIIDGHYATSVTPKDKVTIIFVLRRNPIELREFMVKCGFKDQKLWENMASEILDVCLVESLQAQEERKVCELDVSQRTAKDVVDDLSAILAGRKKCRIGEIDWLGMLEAQGILDEYLRT